MFRNSFVQPARRNAVQVIFRDGNIIFADWAKERSPFDRFMHIDPVGSPRVQVSALLKFSRSLSLIKLEARARE